MPAKPSISTSPDFSAAGLRAAFDAPAALTVGLEEEVMLLDPETLDLAPLAAAVLERVAGDARFKGELPAAHVELVTPPCDDVSAALALLTAARRDLVDAVADLARPAAAGVHPFAAPAGELTPGPRYDALAAEYGPIGRRQLIASLQVHVAVGGAARTLAVYNALRSHLPDIAALAANAAFYDGRDAQLASVRPAIAGMLPRQGMPPRLESWAAFATELRWGEAAGVPVPRTWWWELRPHPGFGTLEVRVPDAQTTLAEAAGVAAFVHALVGWLAERHDGGERLLAAPSWRIEENRWSALRHGVEGTMADLGSGERTPTRERLRTLLAEVAPIAQRLGAAPLLVHAEALIERNGAIRQREAAALHGGVRGLTAWMAERFDDRAPSARPPRVAAPEAG